MNVSLFVAASQTRGSSGAPIPPLAGSTVVANGSGGATWGADAAAPLNLTVYVSVTGDNKMNGETPATAVRTIDAAVGIVQRRGWTISAAIRLLPGVHDLAGNRVIRGDGAPGARMQNLVIRGDSVSVIQTGTVLGAALLGNLTEVTITSMVLPPAKGARVRFTSGALIGQRYVVGYIGGAKFVLMGNVLPDPGDTLVLEIANATINVLDGLMFNGGPRILSDVRVYLPPQIGSLPAMLLVDTTLLMSGVTFTTATPSPAFVVLNRSTLAAGMGITGIPGVEANPLGFSMIGVGGPNIGVLCQGGTLPIQGCYFSETVLLASSNGVVSLAQSLCERCVCSASDGADWTSAGSRILDAPGDGLVVDGSSARVTSVDISNSAGSGINVSASDLRIDSSLTSATANAGTGIRIGQQGRVTVYDNGSGATITGLSNPDVFVGTNGAATWADLIAGVVPRSDFTNPLTTFSSISIA
jgi:hypothetical protein